MNLRLRKSLLLVASVVVIAFFMLWRPFGGNLPAGEGLEPEGVRGSIHRVPIDGAAEESDSRASLVGPSLREAQLLLVDPTGNSVGGVSARTSGGQVLGPTAEDGQLVVSFLSNEEEVGLEIVRAGYLPVPPLQLQAGERRTLELTPMLAGQVWKGRGERPASGALVAAWPESQSFGAKAAWAVLGGADPPSGVLIGECDQEGRFMLPAPAPGRRYRLSCGSEGWVSFKPLASVAESAGDPLELRLWPVHGAIIRYLEETGAPLSPPESRACSVTPHSESTPVGAHCQSRVRPLPWPALTPGSLVLPRGGTLYCSLLVMMRQQILPSISA